MSSLQSLREFISERLAAAAEEIFRHCEGTIVQYEQELCRQRRLLDVFWKPQIQPNTTGHPKHYVTEEKNLGNQQKNFKVEQEEPEPPQIKEKQEKRDVNLETGTSMETPTIEEKDHSEPDQNNQHSFIVTDSKSEEGSQHDESTSTADEVTDTQIRYQKKRRNRSHVQSVASSHMSEGQSDSDIKKTSVKKGFPKLGNEQSDKSSITVKNLQMTTEASKTQYVCEECGKSFSSWSKITLHWRGHTGEKPFSCKACNKSFSRTSSLKRHIQTHTREKPFSCKECDKRFSCKSYLKRHTRTHARKKHIFTSGI